MARKPTWTVPSPLKGLLALVAVGGILTLLGLGLSHSNAPVTIDIDGRHYAVHTRATTVREAIRRGGFALYPEDRIMPDLETVLQPGMVIQIQKAQPVMISADGHQWQVRTHSTTIGALLAEAGVGWGPADEIWLNGQRARLDTPIVNQGALASRQVSYRGGQRSLAVPGSDPPLVALRRATTINLDDNGTQTAINTLATTVGQVLQETGVTLYLGDEITPGIQERITPGTLITIHRSVPVQIQVDGNTLRTRTRAETIAGVLGEEGVALVGRDRVEPGLAQPIQPFQTIRVTRVREEFAVEFDSIPFKTVWVGDPEVEIDNIRLVQQGQVGLTKRRYRVVYEDGNETERTLEDTWTAQAPVTKTMAYGTKIVIRTLETPNGPVEYWRKIRVYLVSYKPSSCGKSRDDPRYGYTRLGWYLKKGIVAVDPKLIPLKSYMYVPHYGIARAGDTGGGVKGKMVDLGYGDDDYQSWHWWGDVYIMTPVPPRSQILWILPNYPSFPDRRR